MTWSNLNHKITSWFKITKNEPRFTYVVLIKPRFANNAQKNEKFGHS